MCRWTFGRLDKSWRGGEGNPLCYHTGGLIIKLKVTLITIQCQLIKNLFYFQFESQGKVSEIAMYVSTKNIKKILCFRRFIWYQMNIICKVLCGPRHVHGHHRLDGLSTSATGKTIKDSQIIFINVSIFRVAYKLNATSCLKGSFLI